MQNIISFCWYRDHFQLNYDYEIELCVYSTSQQHKHAWTKQGKIQ